MGKACVPGMVNSGYAFIVLSIFPVLTQEISGYFGGVVLFIFGVFLAFTTCGVDLDINNNRLNYYRIFFFFIKTHRWIDISKYEYITVLIFNKEYVIKSQSNRSNSQKEKKYEVYLLDESKYNRQLVASFHHAKSATDFAKAIAEKLKKEYIAYHLDKSWE